ncbi:MAG: histidinol dehydrogenase [Lentisphaerae bacterium]|nr:histidinol dehydrogenase [Lentisphaerota bacterium]
MLAAVKGRRIKAVLRAESLGGMTRQRREALLARSRGRMAAVRPRVDAIIEAVRRGGDAALRRYTKQFDGVALPAERLVVSPAELRRARRAVARRMPDLDAAMRTALDCITAYHTAELEAVPGGASGWRRRTTVKRGPARGAALTIGQLRVPLDRVGAYVPGGRAALISTALMTIVPARVAGVKEIVVCSPPSRDGDIDPRILAAADLAGATAVIRAGGAQAVAALAYGTPSVPRVSKIVGPGNIYVAAAKAAVAARGACGIDFLAGPSEVVIVADASADPEWVARDLVAQAEHDTDACAVLVTDSRRLARDVERQVGAVLEAGGGPLAGIAAQALARYGAIITADSLDAAMDFANAFAPEHLQLMVRQPARLLRRVRNAGAVFAGAYTPVPLGDYLGPNHTLPTAGAARFTAGLSVDMFLKKPATLQVSRKAVRILAPVVAALARAEGLTGEHVGAVRARAAES